MIPVKRRGRPTNRPSAQELSSVYAKHTMRETAEYYDVSINTVKGWLSHYRKEEALTLDT